MSADGSGASRVILCADLDYFYAQCEELRDPSLKDVPVVVCVFSARGAESGAVATANYKARLYGVKSGMPIARAKRLLSESKNARFLPADFDFYETVSARVMEILRSYADCFEQVSVDEAYLDVTERSRGDFEEARRLALEIKRVLREAEGLTCTIGIGPNKLIAKMASDYGKPDGLTVVKVGEEESFLAPLPVRKLYGVGVKTEKKLNEMGIRTIGELARFDVDTLISLFGKKYGVYLHNAARGVDDTPVKGPTGPESLSRITTLKENTRDVEKVWPQLEPLIEELHARLGQEGFLFRLITVSAVMEDLSVRSKSRSSENPTDSVAILKKTARELLEALAKEDGGLLFRRIGIKVGGLSSKVGQLRLAEFLKIASDVGP